MNDRVWIGLDTAAAWTALCATNEQGEIIEEYAVRTVARDVHAAIHERFEGRIATVGMEACSTSIALARGLKKLGHNVALFDCGQVKRFASIRRSKTDANDARSIADVARLGSEVLMAVHLKSSACFMMRSKLAVRHSIVRQRKATEELIRSFLALHGQRLDVKITAPHRLRPHVLARIAAIREETGDDIAGHLEPLLDMAERQRHEVARLDREVLAFATNEPVCRRFMDVPGVGALTAVSFYTAIEDPARFSRSSDVGAYLGLTPKVYQTGTISRRGRITKAGNGLTRFHLVAAANALLNATRTDSALRRWGLQRAAAIGRPKARVAVARKLASILFSLWRDDVPFQPLPMTGPDVTSTSCGGPSGSNGVETPFNHVERLSDSEAAVLGLDAANPCNAGLTEKQRQRIEREQVEREAAMDLWKQGMKVGRIAAELGLTVETVYRRLPHRWATRERIPVTATIRDHTLELADGEVILPKQFRDVGQTTAVHGALKRLVGEGILRVGERGIYVRNVSGKS